MKTNKSFSPKQWANINTAEQIRTVTNRIVEMGIDITAGYNRWRNIAFGISLDLTGSPAGAMKIFLVFYIACVVITWLVYGRNTKKNK